MGKSIEYEEKVSKTDKEKYEEKENLHHQKHFNFSPKYNAQLEWNINTIIDLDKCLYLVKRPTVFGC